MAMSVVYTTINGQIVHENRGGVEAFYAPDTLGSTVALLSTTGSVTDTYTYQPYGEIVSHVGSSVTPFTFVGTLGYYLDVLGSQIYVRARYLRQALTRWQTLDPVWPFERAFAYVNCAPSHSTDPSGMSIWNNLGDCLLKALAALAKGLATCVGIVGAGCKTCLGGLTGICLSQPWPECWAAIQLCGKVCGRTILFCLGKSWQGALFDLAKCLGQNLLPPLQTPSQIHQQCMKDCKSRGGPCQAMNALDLELCCEDWCKRRSC